MLNDTSLRLVTSDGTMWIGMSAQQAGADAVRLARPPPAGLEPPPGTVWYSGRRQARGLILLLGRMPRGEPVQTMLSLVVGTGGVSAVLLASGNPEIELPSELAGYSLRTHKGKGVRNSTRLQVVLSREGSDWVTWGSTGNDPDPRDQELLDDARRGLEAWRALTAWSAEPRSADRLVQLYLKAGDGRVEGLLGNGWEHVLRRVVPYGNWGAVPSEVGSGQLCLARQTTPRACVLVDADRSVGLSQQAPSRRSRQRGGVGPLVALMATPLIQVDCASMDLLRARTLYPTVSGPAEDQMLRAATNVLLARHHGRPARASCLAVLEVRRELHGVVIDRAWRFATRVAGKRIRSDDGMEAESRERSRHKMRRFEQAIPDERAQASAAIMSLKQRNKLDPLLLEYIVRSVRK